MRYLPRLNWKIVAGSFLLLILIYSSVRLIQTFFAYRDVARQETRLQEQADLLKKQNSELLTKLRIAKTPEAIERDSKARLNMKISGEQVVVVVPGTTTPANAPSQKNIFQRVWSWFARVF